MRCYPFLLAIALVSLPAVSAAHSGGALDADGCHVDHRTGDYHCHRGPAGGYTFPNRAAMLEAVRTGNFPDKTVEEEGFFSKLWPFGRHDDEDDGGSAAAEAAGSDTGTADGQSATPERQREFEQRLKTLQGLYEMGLLSREEYEAKRKEVLDEL